jgi:hypothetical protein
MCTRRDGVSWPVRTRLGARVGVRAAGLPASGPESGVKSRKLRARAVKRGGAEVRMLLKIAAEKYASHADWGAFRRAPGMASGARGRRHGGTHGVVRPPAAPQGREQN